MIALIQDECNRASDFTDLDDDGSESRHSTFVVSSSLVDTVESRQSSQPLQ